MDCPYCGGDSRVSRTTTPDGGQRLIVRERQCVKDTTHRFSTEEHERITLADIAVHQRSGLLVPYDRKVLRDSVSQALLMKQTPDGDLFVVDLVDRVEMRIVRRSLGLKRISPGEHKQLAERARRADASSRGRGDALRALRVSLRDRDVEDAVDEELAQTDKSRALRTMYALTVKGRQGSPTSHPGWKDADDFLEWVRQEMPGEIGGEMPPRMEATVHRLAVSPVRFVPQRVVKRDGGTMDFDLDRFMRSLTKALQGRRDENIKARGVAWSTLARLSGQQVVHTAQLAATALELLRAADEIAYLRAAVRFKKLSSVRDISAEASGLRTNPSEKFVFSEPTASVSIPHPTGAQ